MVSEIVLPSPFGKGIGAFVVRQRPLHARPQHAGTAYPAADDDASHQGGPRAKSTATSTTWVDSKGVWRHRSGFAPYADHVAEQRRKLPKALSSRIGHASSAPTLPRVAQQAPRPPSPQLGRSFRASGEAASELDRRIAMVQDIFGQARTDRGGNNKASGSLASASGHRLISPRLEALAEPRRREASWAASASLTSASSAPLGANGEPLKRPLRKAVIPTMPPKWEERIEAAQKALEARQRGVDPPGAQAKPQPARPKQPTRPPRTKDAPRALDDGMEVAADGNGGGKDAGHEAKEEAVGSAAAPRSLPPAGSEAAVADQSGAGSSAAGASASNGASQPDGAGTTAEPLDVVAPSSLEAAGGSSADGVEQRPGTAASDGDGLAMTAGAEAFEPETPAETPMARESPLAGTQTGTEDGFEAETPAETPAQILVKEPSVDEYGGGFESETPAQTPVGNAAGGLDSTQGLQVPATPGGASQFSGTDGFESDDESSVSQTPKASTTTRPSLRTGDLGPVDEGEEAQDSQPHPSGDSGDEFEDE